MIQEGRGRSVRQALVALRALGLLVATILVGCSLRGQRTPTAAPIDRPARTTPPAAPTAELERASAPAAAARAAAPAWEVYFSPRGGCTEALMGEIAAGQKQVLVQAYAFSSRPIRDALLAAKARGVDVEVILDSKWEREHDPAAMAALIAGGVTVFLDGAHSIAHNKVCVVDSQTVCTGSFNYTEEAETSNAENLLVVHDVTLAGKYVDNWNLHWGHSTPTRRAVAEESAPAAAEHEPAPKQPAPAVRAPAAQVASPQSVQQGPDEVVYVTAKGKDYHRQGCRLLRHSAYPMLRSQAEAKGYRPCRECRP